MAAANLAEQLNDLNRQRVSMGRRAERQMTSSEDRTRLASGPLNVQVAETATPGIAGLVASYLVRQYGWPAIVLAVREDGNLAGSGRSALGFDLGLAVSKALEAGLAVSGGGHAAACGVVLESGMLEDFRRFMANRFRARRSVDDGPSEPTHVIDATLAGSWLEPGRLKQTANALDGIAPWGAGMRLPLFGIRDCMLARGRVLKNGHLALTVVTGGHRVQAMWWNPPWNWAKRLGLSDESEIRTPRTSPFGNFDLAGSLETDDWQGRRNVRLVVRDARPRGPQPIGRGL